MSTLCPQTHQHWPPGQKSSIHTPPHPPVSTRICVPSCLLRVSLSRLVCLLMGLQKSKHAFSSQTDDNSWILAVATLKSVTEMSMFSGTGHTTIPLYGFLMPGCQLWSCTTTSPVRQAHVSVRHTCLWFLGVYLGAHASVPPGPHHPQLVWLPVEAHKHGSTG